jgi:hypothetical protein
MADTKKVIIEVEVNQGADLEVLKKQLDEIGVRLKKTKLASDDASKSMSAGFKAGADAASIIPGPIGQAATAMNGLTSGVGKFVSALGTVKGALIATGVGAFVVVIGTLITYFTETEKGAQKLRVVMAGLGAVVRTVADAIMTLNFSDLTSKIKDNTNAAIANANALNKVEEAEGDLTVKRAEANKEIAKARLIADDMTKSTEERIAAVQKAGAIEEAVAREELQIAAMKLKALEDNMNRKADASEEERDQVDEAKVRMADLERETIMRQKRLGSEVQGLKNEEAAADKERDAQHLADKKARNDAEVQLAKERADELVKQEAERARRFEEVQKAEHIKKDWFDEQKAKTQEEKDALEIERALQAAKDKHQIVSDAIFSLKLTQDEKLALWDEANKLLKVELFETETAMMIEDEQKRQDAIQAIKDKAEALAATKAQKILDEEKRIRELKIRSARSLASTLGSIGDLLQQQGLENTAAAKTLAVAQILIDTAIAISGAIATATRASATPWDMIAGITAGIAAVVSGIASATSILNKANVGGASASSPSVASVSSMASTAPQIDPVTTNTTQLGNTEQAELMPIQAFVVETQITGSQNNINQIESQATFGGG